MYGDLHYLVALLFLFGGLYLLSCSANWFVDGASALARAFGVSPFVVGMVIIGFGTSAPELMVSALTGISDHSNLSLGNAYGSCIFNIAAILGIAALIRPLRVRWSISWVAAPLLVAMCGVAFLLVRDMSFSRTNGFMLLGLFAVVMPLYCWFDRKGGGGPQQPEQSSAVSLPRAWVLLLGGLAVLVGSSHLLVWGAVDVARDVAQWLGFEAKRAEMIIGLTVVAAGTSLPELASAVASARKGEHEFVLGNIVGSNLFNMLAVVGMAGSISPFSGYSSHIVTRDIPMMAALSLSILVFGANCRSPRSGGSIGRRCGVVWLAAFLVYASVMIYQEMH